MQVRATQANHCLIESDSLIFHVNYVLFTIQVF